MKSPRIVGWLLLLAMITLAFIGGAATAIYRGWGSPLVYVEVVNKSGADLRSVRLEYEACGSKQELLGGSLHIDGRTQLMFQACGEAGYKLSVVFADGTKNSAEGYAERGYRIVHVVEPQRIRSETNVYRL